MSAEKEYFQGRSVDEHDPIVIYRPLFWLGLLVAGLFWANNLFAEPILRGESNGVVITIYDEKCTHPEVTNLPYRATWAQDGKVFDGCVGAFTGFGVAAFWFDDKTVSVVPLQLFKKLTSA